MTPAARAGGDERLGAVGRDLERLLQEHVLAGGGGPGDELAVGVRRGQDQHRVDRGVVEDRLEAVGEREREALGEGGAARRGRAEGGGDLDLGGEVEERAGVRRHRHAEADEAEPQPPGQASSSSPFSAIERHRDHALAGGGVEDPHPAGAARAEGDVGDRHADRLAGVGGEHDLVVGLDREERHQRAAAHRPVHRRDALAAAAAHRVVVARRELAGAALGDGEQQVLGLGHRDVAGLAELEAVGGDRLLVVLDLLRASSASSSGAPATARRILR